MGVSVIGETAAILVSCLWTVNTLVYVAAGKRIGSISVNAYRMVIAVGLIGSVLVLSQNTQLSVASYKHWFWIGLSGIVGLGISDLSLIASFMMIGPRRSALITSLSPIVASIGSYFLLGEMITPSAVIGMVITLTGIVVVILEKPKISRTHKTKTVVSQGVFFAFVGAIGQGIALTFAKKGMYLNPEVTIDPLSAAFIRVISGVTFMWLWVFIMGKGPELREALKNRSGIKYTSVSAFIGPFLGVTLALVAVTFTQIGIALTLMNLSPIIIIPVLWMLYKEKSSWRAMIGAVVAVIGVTILFLT